MKRRLPITFCLGLVLAVGAAAQSFPNPDGGSVRPGTLPLTWDTGGPKCMEMAEWQIHEYNPDFFILRQSGCTDYEKPFVYLLFGKERALLYDTGSRKGNLAPTLQQVMHLYLVRNKLAAMPLIVTHSHSHGDHIAGDAQLQALNDPAIPVTFIAPTVDGVKGLYKIANWPGDVGSVDLGGRVVDAIPIPGHDAASVALYDRQTAILLTGDSVYPGRIYIRDFAAFAASNTRMVKFTADKPVSHILGCHIEESRTPFVDYPVGTIYQPNEHALSLSRGDLLEMEAAVEALHGTAKRVAYANFSLWPSGAAFRAQDQGQQDAYKQRQQYQAEHMWDQTNTAPKP